MSADVAIPGTPSFNALADRLHARAEGAAVQPQESQRSQRSNEQSLIALQAAIYKGHLIVGNRDGTWQVRYRITQVVLEILDLLFGKQFIKSANLELATFFENYLKSFELKRTTFKKGIAFGERNDDLIESTKEAIIRRLRDHEIEEERQIRVTWETVDGDKVTKTLQQLIDERTVFRKHQKLHLKKEEELKASDYKALEKKLFELDTHIRDGRKKAYASLGIHRIERQAISMMYRERNQKKIYNKKNRTQAFKTSYDHNKRWLTNDLLAWKKEALEMRDKNKKKTPTPHVRAELTTREEEKIGQTCFFPKFVALLKEDPQIRDEYYKFVFRNTADGGKDAADIAIQLPVHQKRLMKCILDKREGRLHDLFKIEEAPFHEEGEALAGLRKFVSLKIEGQQCDIFDEAKTVTFDAATPYKVTRTVKDIFKSLEMKNEVMGEFETIQSKGIVRLHGVMNPEFAEPLPELSLFEFVAQAIYSLFSSTARPLQPCIDLISEDWMRQIKPFESITSEEVVARYGVKPEHALIVARATRLQPLEETDTVIINESHSFLELVAPNDQGSYNVYPIGKYAFPWPRGDLDTFLYIFNTQRGIIRMDENSFYKHRHQAAYSMQAGPEQVKRFWEKIRRDLQKERNNEIIFQAQGNNCSVWAEETLDFAFQNPARPRLYEVSYLKGSGPEPVSYIIDLLQFVARTVSEQAANITRLFVCFVFGAWRGYTTGAEGDGPTERLFTNETWRSEKLMLPGALFERCLQDSQENMRGYFTLKVGAA